MKKESHLYKMAPVKNKTLRMYLIILVLSNILLSTMTAAFRITKNTSTGVVTQKATSTSVVPVTAALELKSVKSTASTTNDKTGSTTRPNPTSANLSNLKGLKDTAAEVKKLHINTQPTTVSVVHDQSHGKIPQMSGKAKERTSASPTTPSLLTKVSFSKIMHTQKSSPTVKPVSLEERQLNVSDVIGRKMLSITKYENSLSSTTSPSSKTSTARSTRFITKTTTLPPSFKSLATNTHSANGISVTNTPKTGGSLSGKFLLTSVNVSPSTKAKEKVTHSPSNALYRSTNGNKNGNVNNNSFGLLGRTQNLDFHNDPLATVPGRNDKDKTARTIDTTTSNNLSTLQVLTTVSKLLTVPPKEKYSSTTSKSTLPGMGFSSDKQTAILTVENTTSTNKMTDVLGTKADHTGTSKPTTSRMPIDTPYTTTISSKSESEVTTEGTLVAEVNNRSANKPENRMDTSSPHLSNIFILLGTTAAPNIRNGGPSAKNANIEVHGYKESSNILTFSPSIKSLEERNMNEVSNSSPLHKEESNKSDSTFNSEQIKLWQEKFIGLLRTMVEHYKGNNNIIIVPISIINNSGNVYLMDKNQGSQFSVGEAVNNKSQLHSLTTKFTDSENDVASTALAHLSTAVPTFISEKSTKLSEPEEYEDDETPTTQKRKYYMDEKHGDIDDDTAEFVSGRVPAIHSKTKESSTKLELMEMKQRGNIMKEKIIKPVNSVETVAVRNGRSSGNSHEVYDVYDSEDTRKSYRQAKVAKKVPKTISPRMKISARENERFGTDEIDENDLAEDTEYPTRTLDETVRYKQNFRDRKHPSVLEEDIYSPYNGRIPETDERR